MVFHISSYGMVMHSHRIHSDLSLITFPMKGHITMWYFHPHIIFLSNVVLQEEEKHCLVEIVRSASFLWIVIFPFLYNRRRNMNIDESFQEQSWKVTWSLNELFLYLIPGLCLSEVSILLLVIALICSSRFYNLDKIYQIYKYFWHLSMFWIVARLISHRNLRVV